MDDFTAFMLIGIFSLILTWVCVCKPNWLAALWRWLQDHAGKRHDRWN